MDGVDSHPGGVRRRPRAVRVRAGTVQGERSLSRSQEGRIVGTNDADRLSSRRALTTSSRQRTWGTGSRARHVMPQGGASRSFAQGSSAPQRHAVGGRVWVDGQARRDADRQSFIPIGRMSRVTESSVRRSVTRSQSRCRGRTGSARYEIGSTASGFTVQGSGSDLDR